MEIVYKARETDKEYTEEEIRTIAIHEASHAVVCEVLRPGHTSVVSILSDDNISAGVTSYYDEGYSTSKGLEDLVTISLGGQAGVEVILGEHDVGAMEDLQHAIDLLTLWAGKNTGGGFPHVVSRNNGISERKQTAQELLIAEKLNEHYERAKEIIFKNRLKTERLCDALLKEKTLLHSDIERIMSTKT